MLETITAETLPPTAPQAGSKTNRTSPRGSKGLKLPELENGHMKVERLSNLRTGLLYAQGDNLGTHLC